MRKSGSVGRRETEKKKGMALADRSIPIDYFKLLLYQRQELLYFVFKIKLLAFHGWTDTKIEQMTN